MIDNLLVQRTSTAARSFPAFNYEIRIANFVFAFAAQILQDFFCLLGFWLQHCTRQI
ncbi:hypothetical protein OROMI_014081 [Orobanche minor]